MFWGREWAVWSNFVIYRTLSNLVIHIKIVRILFSKAACGSLKRNVIIISGKNADVDQLFYGQARVSLLKLQISFRLGFFSRNSMALYRENLTVFKMIVETFLLERYVTSLLGITHKYQHIIQVMVRVSYRQLDVKHTTSCKKPESSLYSCP
jgi:hypothetical protein